MQTYRQSINFLHVRIVIRRGHSDNCFIYNTRTNCSNITIYLLYKIYKFTSAILFRIIILKISDISPFYKSLACNVCVDYHRIIFRTENPAEIPRYFWKYVFKSAHKIHSTRRGNSSVIVS